MTRAISNKALYRDIMRYVGTSVRKVHHVETFISAVWGVPVTHVSYAIHRLVIQGA